MKKAYDGLITFKFDRDKDKVPVSEKCKIRLTGDRMELRFDVEEKSGYELWAGTAIKNRYGLKLIESKVNGLVEQGGTGYLIANQDGTYEGTWDQPGYGTGEWRIHDVKLNKKATEMLNSADLIR